MSSVPHCRSQVHDPTNPAKSLLSNPDVSAAVNRIAATCGQLSVREPFLNLCDASLGYHLPSCLRFLEATHTVEILREAGPGGLHVQRVAEINGTDERKLTHILHLLSTHHILREVSPNVFANNRVSGYMDTRKKVEDILRSPETKYEGTNGIAAFVGLNTDELFKSSSYLTETYALNSHTKYSTEPADTPFGIAFGTRGGYFGWLEGERDSSLNDLYKDCEDMVKEEKKASEATSGNKFRLERFGKAME